MILRRTTTAALAAALSLSAIPAPADIQTVFSHDIESPSIVFNADDLHARRLPERIHERDLAPVPFNDVAQACRSLASRPGARIVYDPLGQVCRPERSLPRATRSLVRQAFDDPAMDDSGSLVVILRSAPKGSALSCACPPPGDEPVIIKNGFEGL